MRLAEQRVGESIRKTREAKGWLQRELSVAARLPLRTIGRIERGEVDVRLSTLGKIARALGVSIRDLLP
jgi:transcriptional regulator with XRE-family HTH domain